jgi:hypothetical protein
MEPFKVICKNDLGWVPYPVVTRIVTTSKLFGLIKSTKVIADTRATAGPAKEEYVQSRTRLLRQVKLITYWRDIHSMHTWWMRL